MDRARERERPRRETIGWSSKTKNKGPGFKSVLFKGSIDSEAEKMSVCVCVYMYVRVCVSVCVWTEERGEEETERKSSFGQVDLNMWYSASSPQL